MGEKDRLRRRDLLRGAAVSVGGASALTGCLSASSPDQSASADLQSKTYVHRAGSTNPTSEGEETTTQSSDSDEYVLQEGGIRWGSFPVETVVGISTVPDDVSTEAARDAITASFDAWNSVSDVDTVFASPTFDDSLTQVTGENETNEFVWSSLDEGTLGRATVYWDGETQRLEEVDIRLNQEFAWSTAPDTAGVYDVQSLATHEIGHHGLDDVTDSDAAEQTMYHQTSDASTKKRTLESGDIAGWQTAYGSRS